MAGVRSEDYECRQDRRSALHGQLHPRDGRAAALQPSEHRQTGEKRPDLAHEIINSSVGLGLLLPV